MSTTLLVVTASHRLLNALSNFVNAFAQFAEYVLIAQLSLCDFLIYCLIFVISEKNHFLYSYKC